MVALIVRKINEMQKILGLEEEDGYNSTFFVQGMHDNSFIRIGTGCL